MRELDKALSQIRDHKLSEAIEYLSRLNQEIELLKELKDKGLHLEVSLDERGILTGIYSRDYSLATDFEIRRETNNHTFNGNDIIFYPKFYFEINPKSYLMPGLNFDNLPRNRIFIYDEVTSIGERGYWLREPLTIPG